MNTTPSVRLLAAAAALLLCAAPALADSPWIYGIHWFGPQSNASDINEMAGGKPLWIVETVMTNDGGGQWGPEGQLANFQNTVRLGHTIIMRIQPVWGKAFPLPADTSPSMATFLDQVTHTATLFRDVCHIWHLGNEMNLTDEWGGQQLTPEAYIDAAAQVSDRIKAVTSSLGRQLVLVGPVSPGAAEGGRWLSSTDYLSRMCDRIKNMNLGAKFDGFAMHAYGNPFTQDPNTIMTSFESATGEGYQYHLGIIDAKGFANSPVYITEWNRYVGSADSEPASAVFLHNAFSRMNTWNQSHHPVVCACWFIYPDNYGWPGFSILDMKNNDTPDRDLWHAFQYACTLNLHAGSGAQTAAGFYKAGWNLTSVPVEPFSPDANAVFQDLADVGNTIANHLYRYDPGGYTIYPLGFTNIARGRGSWLWLGTAPAGTVVSVAGQEATTDVSLSLSPGWNLIGHAFTQPVALSSLHVSQGATTRSFDDAVAHGWIGGSLYYWEIGPGYRIARSGTGYAQDTSLRPWRGYWVQALVTGLQLIVPRPS